MAIAGDIKKIFNYIVKNKLFTDKLVTNLQSKDYCSKNLSSGKYPVLLKLDKSQSHQEQRKFGSTQARYYDPQTYIISFKNEDYLFTSQLFEEQRPHYYSWFFENFGISAEDIILKNDFNMREELKSYIERGYKDQILKMREFVFLKARNALDDLKSYGGKDSKKFFQDSLAQFVEFDGTYRDFLPTLAAGSREHTFFETIGKFVAHVDYHGYNKSIWNLNEDKRTIAHTAVRQGEWVKILIQFKISGNNVASIKDGNIKKTIIYLENPSNELTMLSDKHRKYFSESILNKEYNALSFSQDLLLYFNSVPIPVSNPDNKSAYVCYFLYEEDIKPHWLNTEEESIANEDENEDKNEDKKETFMSKNTIFFGPPGTGKTYNSINKAIKIINPDFNLNQKRDIVKAEYDRLVDLGQIVFSTFHQSMSYEDFIEGIKPVLDSGGESIKYEIQPGVFKRICDRARSIETIIKNTDVKLESATYYKMSLGGKGRSDIHDYCISENVIALGYGGEEDLTSLSKIIDAEEFKKMFILKHPELSAEKKFNIQAARFFLKMKVGDVVIISKGNHIIDAIGVIDSDYIYNADSPIDYCHFRKVKWLAKNLNSNPERFLEKQVSQMSIYEFYNKDIKINALKELLSNTVIDKEKNYVLIIDEINRGNVSQIFGELITLVEDNKRLGCPEAVKVILPYSKMPFGVPSNVHIIGTMNTADRSVEALDTALRRRFTFEEMPPSLEVLEKNLKFKDDDIDLVQILETINQRLEKLLNKDHLIGHSFFLKVKSLNDLKSTFANEIVPLLQEYFYGDFGKIGLVLGSGFIEDISKVKSVKFAKFDDYNLDDLEARPVYKIKDLTNLKDSEFKNVVLSILGK